MTSAPASPRRTARPNAWWQTITVSPSDPLRIYLSGYRSAAHQPREILLLFESTDGARRSPRSRPRTFVTFADLRSWSRRHQCLERRWSTRTSPRKTACATRPVSQRRRRRALDARCSRSRSCIRVPATWQRRPLVGTQLGGTSTSRTTRAARGSSIRTAPHVNCLAETAAGVVWACTANYDVMAARRRTARGS